MLPRRRQAEETVAAFRMSCLKSLGVVLAFQVAAAWATGVTPAAGAAAAAPAAAAAVNGTPQHAAAESATAAAAAGRGQVGTAQQKTHKCTNVKLFSECRVHCEYVVEGKGAYFIFTDGEDGVPCKTRTLDGQVLNGACQQGLCMVKDQAGVGQHSAAGAAAGAATPASAAGAAAGAVTPGAAAHPAAAAATPAHVAAPAHAAAPAAAPAAATAKHKKA